MVNPKFAFRTLFKTPFVTIVAIVSLALGIGANAAIFSCFNQMLLESLAVPRAGQPGQSGGTGTEAGIAIVQSGGRLRRGLQLRDVPRSPARADDVHRRCGAPALRRQPLVSGANAQRSGADGLWQLLSGAAADAGARAAAQSRGRSRRRRITRRGAQPRVLGHEIRVHTPMHSTSSSSSTARR